ncbi:MAG: recombination protein O N-terminal domain-containing protein [Candidatus Paceibacterota bacterium]|jgi:DNA repair protein RecO (recombination protein O)
MHHKYETRGIVLSRTPMGEANALVTVLTPEVGLVRARAQGVRRMGAKLAAALATFAESELVLVRGKESWRIAGAVLYENWFSRMNCTSARLRAARVSGLLLRLVAGESNDEKLFSILTGFFAALATFPEELHEAAETLAVLRILSILGLDTGSIPGDEILFAQSTLAAVKNDRVKYLTRINHGIEASGL